MQNPNTFANNPLDRASALRKEPEWLAAQTLAPDARYLPFALGKPLIVLADGAPAALGWMRRREIGPLVGERETLFLGLDAAGGPRFAVDITGTDGMEPPAPLERGKFIEVRSIAPDLPIPDTGILAQAKALLEWHRTHPHCARCGAPTVVSEAGYKRTCPTCRADHFPRTDPVVIMLVIDGDSVLMGQGVNFPPGRYSALAGFVEPGETFEEAVAREVLEESAVRVSHVEYYASQPWPWPMSIMIGCFATATSREIEIDPEEIADARWFSRDELATAVDYAANNRIDFRGPANPTNLPEGIDFIVPPPSSMAHQLMRGWLDGKFRGA